ncbi:MAG: Ribosome-recycling factor [candidate division TM6 bacterium GW2011_GWF2_43_17]|nr:MAG: Ribosome-recycling factor [candidate division TM6 bacterium GW2011_GWF2_43_17]HAU30521.1 ribosome recycling factor [Candidatus Dependentiae bacterium]
MIDLSFSPAEQPHKLDEFIRQAMQEHIDYFDRELSKLRTNRANSALVEDLMVSCYGSMMRLKDLATITTPDAQTITIQPWDQTNVDAIEKAITQSDLNLNPTNDGAHIRLNLPPMSAARREELVKTLHKKLEDCRIAIRNERKEFNNLIRDLEKAKAVSEDIAKRLQTLLQKATDDLTQKAESAAQRKEKEVLSV